jgi:5-methylcytosine-specific restriction enzyme A
MFDKPMMPCRQPGCSALVRGGGYCEQHRPGRRPEPTHHKQRQTQRFKRARAAYLYEHPWCELCNKAPAEVLDHIKPHKGDYELFWDIENWQGLCRVCHNRKSQGE